MGSHHGLKQEGWPKVSDVELKNYFASTRSVTLDWRYY